MAQKDSLRSILTNAGVLDAVDAAQSECLNFAIAMHNRMIEKQKEIAGTYNAEEAVSDWCRQETADLNGMLLAIGKNVSELAKEVKDNVVSNTASVDIANLALIVDTNLRKNYGS